MKLLEDPTGIYLLSAIASIHPVQIKGEPRDQSRVTAVHTRIIMAGGGSHETAIPYDKAVELLRGYHEPALAAASPPA